MKFTRICILSALLSVPAALFGQTTADLSIHVNGSGFSIQTLKNGAAAFANRNYVWQCVPARFQGWDYTQTLGGQKADIIVSAKQDGVIYMVTAPGQNGVDLTGWTPVPGAAFSYDDPKGTSVDVYSQPYHAGAKVEISLANWSGGIILAPHIANADETGSDRVLTAATAYDIDQLGKIVAADPRALSAADKAGLGIIQTTLREGQTSSDADKANMRATVSWLLSHGADPNLHPQGRPRTPLAIAIDNGDLSLVTMLLAAGADPNLSDGNRQTPFEHLLQYSSGYQVAGSATAADLFKAITTPGNKIPFDPKRAGSDGSYPLPSLVMSTLGTVANVSALLSLGADINVRVDDPPLGRFGLMNYNGVLPNLAHGDQVDLGLVDLAVLAQNDDLLSFFVGKGLSVNDRTMAGDTPLHYAAAQRSNMIATLLALHANPNARNDQGESPAEFALDHGSFQPADSGAQAEFRAFLKTADLTHKNRQGFTPLMQAIQDRNWQNALDILSVYKPTDRIDKAELAVAENDVATLAPLLSTTPGLAHQRLANGRTLLHMASIWRSSLAANLLLKHGADAAARDALGETPLSLLTSENRLELQQSVGMNQDGPLPVQPAGAGVDPQVAVIVALSEKLLAAGASANAVGEAQLRPLAFAAAIDSTELAQDLIRHGANVNARSYNQRAPLSFAKSAEMVDLLVGAGADVHAGREDALNNAVNSNNVAAAESLITHGADINAAHMQGYTTLMGAVQRDNIDMVKMLLDKGAAVDAIGLNGQTAMSLAENNQQLITLLEAHGAKVAPTPDRLQPFPTDTPLTDAINRQDIDAVKAAITEDPTLVNKIGSEGALPLIVALRSGPFLAGKATQIVQYLLESGADPNCSDQSGSTALSIAAQSGSEDGIQLLLDHGASVNGRSADGQTALFSTGSLKAVQLLLAKGGDPNAVDMDGDTPLHAAADFGERAGDIGALLSAGAKPCVWNASGDQPLNILLNERTVTASIPSGLIAGSNLTAPGRSGLNAVEQALETGNPSIRAELLQAKPKLDLFTSFLVEVTQNNAVAVRKALAAHPAFACARLADGATALHLAAIWNALASAGALISSGADMEARDFNGDTPLHWCANGRGLTPDRRILYRGGPLPVNAPSSVPLTADIAAFLLARGADPNAQDAAGQTPLQSAIAAYNPALATLLLTAKANPNLRNNNGDTALHMLVRQDSQDAMVSLVPLLASHGADIGAQTWNQQYQLQFPESPLESAVAVDHPKFASALIAAGASVNAVTRGGNTALFFAARSSDTDVVATLLDAGANVNAVNDLGQTPLDWVISPWKGRNQVAEMLTAHGAHGGSAGPVTIADIE